MLFIINALAEVEAETLAETLGDVGAKTLVNALADTLAEVEAERLGEPLAMWRPKGWWTHCLTR